jgi:hypothetical protein
LKRGKIKPRKLTITEERVYCWNRGDSNGDAWRRSGAVLGWFFFAAVGIEYDERAK